jgi:hypothetical protein
MTDLLNDSRRYVTSNCIPADELVAASGLSPAIFAALAPVMPEPTYRMFAHGISNSVGQIGVCEGPSQDYYGRAVPWWLRRAAEFLRDQPSINIAEAMQSWLAEDLTRVLRERAPDANRFAWGHIVDAGGAVDNLALDRAVDTLFQEWRLGGWCVCLREFDAHHLVTKESERLRIEHLTDAGRHATIDVATRHRLLDAIARLDSVMTPFAPYERPTCTPGKFIDAMVARYCPATLAA